MNLQKLTQLYDFTKKVIGMYGLHLLEDSNDAYSMEHISEEVGTWLKIMLKWQNH